MFCSQQFNATVALGSATVYATVALWIQRCLKITVLEWKVSEMIGGTVVVQAACLVHFSKIVRTPSPPQALRRVCLLS